MLLRVIIAIIAVVLFSVLIEPVCRLLGFPINGDLLLIVRVCVAGIAIYYILTGSKPV